MEGSKLVAEEFENFLIGRSAARDRYLNILEFVTKLRGAQWTDIRKYLEAKEGKNVSSSRPAKLLGNLRDYGFLEKSLSGTYSIPDHLLAEAMKGGIL